MKHLFEYTDYIKENTHNRIELPILYHGTNNDFDDFDLKFFNSGSGDGGWLGEGMYFTNDYDYAKSFADRDGVIISAKITLNNPYILTEYAYSINPTKLIRNLEVFNSNQVTSKLEKMGYDGVLLTYEEDNGDIFYEVCVFNTSSIKIIDKKYT